MMLNGQIALPSLVNMHWLDFNNGLLGIPNQRWLRMVSSLESGVLLVLKHTTTCIALNSTWRINWIGLD